MGREPGDLLLAADTHVFTFLEPGKAKQGMAVE
jgi:hypothetical protein